MTVSQPERLDSLRDLFQVSAPDNDIDVCGRPAGAWLGLFDVEKCCQATHDAIVKSG